MELHATRLVQPVELAALAMAVSVAQELAVVREVGVVALHDGNSWPHLWDTARQ